MALLGLSDCEEIEYDFFSDEDATVDSIEGLKAVSSVDKKYLCPRLPVFVDKLLDEESRKKDQMRTRLKDKMERATVEQVIDKKTANVLFKMLNRNRNSDKDISEMQGCISTGKEANVYYASSASGSEKAIKIYKIKTFQNRQEYVVGDIHYKNKCFKGIKMIQTWAEKEWKNLIRIYSAGLPCPKPIELKERILVMSFIGKKGQAAPLLKNVNLSTKKARELYHDCILMMRSLFHKCKLVHADLSEYNLLYHDDTLFVIDVSQSVELEHPRMTEFLRRDCSNMTNYFRKYNVPVMTVKELFDFITDLNINDENVEEYLAKAQEIASNREWEMTEQEKIDEQVFKQAYIPKRLDEVIDVENDIFSEDRELLYHSVTGLTPSFTVVKPILDEGKENERNSDTESTDSNTSGEQNEQVKNSKVNLGKRDESPCSRKDRKKQLKEDRRKKLQTKIPKHIKKRKEKLRCANSKK